MMRILILFALLALPIFGAAQPAEVVAKLLRATQRLQLRTAQVDSFVQVIRATSTHRHLPTAKAVYDFRLLDTTFTSARLTGLGTQASPLDIAQQGATTGQVLRWNGSAWFPNGTNLYDVVTTSQTVSAQYNQVFVDTIAAPITLNLPPCNASNDGVRFEIVKSGPDVFAVNIDPSGSETFNDNATVKSLYNRGTTLICTCRWAASVGRWHYISM
jgi:hypothetical protein